VTEKRPCPCCGHLVFDQVLGSYPNCPVCAWEEDEVQLRWPSLVAGPSKESLLESQQRFLRSGVAYERMRSFVRPPLDDEPVDDGWRPIDLDVDSFERPFERALPWLDDWSTLYWWRETFWRRAHE